MHVFLETDRLILRRFTGDDADNLYELDSDPDVMRWFTGGQPTPREEVERDILPFYLGEYSRFANFGCWAAIEKASGAFLGWFHLRPERDGPSDELELGYRLRRSAWNKGYGTEGSRAVIAKAFNELGTRRVVAFAYGENVASRRVMEKAGMRLVRTFRPTPEELRAAGFPFPEIFDGDDVEYAITRDEWEQQNRSAVSSSQGSD